LVRAHERLAQQRITLVAVLARAEVVGRLVEEVGNLVRVDEARDVHGLRRFDVGALEVFLLEDDVLPVLPFVAFHDLVERHLVARCLVHALVSDGRHVALVEHREAELVAFLGGEQRYGDVNEAKANRAFLELAGHDFLLNRPAASHARAWACAPAAGEWIGRGTAGAAHGAPRASRAGRAGPTCKAHGSRGYPPVLLLRTARAHGPRARSPRSRAAPARTGRGGRN